MRTPRFLVALLFFLAVWAPPAPAQKADVGDAAAFAGRPAVAAIPGLTGAPAAAFAGGPAASAAAAPFAAPAPGMAPAARPEALALPAAAAAPETASGLPPKSAPSIGDAAGSGAMAVRRSASAPDAGRAAGSVAGQEAGDALFDARRQALHPDDTLALIISGYRFSGDGRLLAPQSGAALTNADVRGLQRGFREQRSRSALLRLQAETAPGASGDRKKALMEVNRDALPREVLKAQSVGPEKERATVLRRLASLYRRWLGKDSQEPPASVEPPNGDVERRLGELVSAAVVKRLGADPEGARLLEELKDEQGRLRLPTIRILRLQAHVGAFYNNYGRQLIVNLDDMRGFLVPRLPEAQRAEAERRLSSEAGALEYLSSDPSRAALLADAEKVVFLHELEHFHQDLQRPLSGALSRGQIPNAVPRTMEYEAYHREALYVHSLLSQPGARLDIDHVDRYLLLIGDFEGWKKWIDDSYATMFLNTSVTIDELSALQERSDGLMKRLAGPEDARSPAASKKLAGAARGDAAIDAERRASDALLAKYRREWPALARQGLRRWAELNEESGRWPQVAWANERLARLAAPGEASSELDKKAQEYEDKSLIRLRDGHDLPLKERLEWIGALAAYRQNLPAPWPRELWIASFRDYAERAARLKADAAAAADEASRIAALNEAKSYENLIQGNRAELHRQAEVNLDALKTETEPRRIALILAWGKMQAGVLGDPRMIAAFESGHAPAAAAAP